MGGAVGNKNYYFKHHNDAHMGQTMAELWGENDYETIAFYWTVLECVSRYESFEKRGTWVGRYSYFLTKLGMKKQRSSRLLSKISQRFSLALKKCDDESFELSVPNWLNFQESRGGKREAKPHFLPDRLKTIDKRHKTEECKTKKAATGKPSAAITTDIGQLFGEYERLAKEVGVKPKYNRGQAGALFKGMIRDFGLHPSLAMIQEYAKLNYWLERGLPLSGLQSSLNELQLRANKPATKFLTIDEVENEIKAGMDAANSGDSRRSDF
jgi:hypothetical protein